MVLAFVIFWLIREVKVMLFWLYLWQLKEYHIGRFLAHFQTARGRRLLLNPWAGAKLILLVGVFFIPNAIFLLIPLYAVEFFLRKAPKPVFTRKIQFLTFALLGVSLVFAFLGSLVFLLIIDILTPLVVSLVVLGLQPFTVLARNRVIEQAKAKRRKMKNLKVVGITGSYGKTSTKEFLAHILGQKFTVLKTPEHTNSEVGIANTILRSLTTEHDVFVCEMGAYGKGGIQLLADMAKPDIAIVTGVNEQHLATFGSMENLLSAEGGRELAEALPSDGMAFVNQTVKSKVQYENAKCKVVYYGGAEKVKIEKEKVSFEFEGVKFEVPAYGGHNVENLLGAIEAARKLGMSLQEIARAAASMPLGLGALKVKKGTNGATIIDSTYSANPDGVIADLEYLSLYEGKRVLVMPCLIELGPAAKEAHKRIGQKIAQVCDQAIITTKEHFEDVKEGAGQSDKIGYVENAQEILEKIKDANAILLESRLPESLIKAVEK